MSLAVLTASITKSKSSFVSDGWTGREITLFAAISAFGHFPSIPNFL